MRRQTPIAHLLYAHLFPSPKPEDPPSFSAHLAKNLVPEVRIEVATFYGDLSTVESRYPGLNYCHAPHRMRLARFPHHRRLFRAFEALGLTECEIQGFCCWEGTLWARERYERDEGVKVRDTTGDEIGPWVDRRTKQDGSGRTARKTDMAVVVEEPLEMQNVTDRQEDDDMSDADEEDAGEHEIDQQRPSNNNTTEDVSDDAAQQEARERLQSSNGALINQRAFAAWEQGRPLDPQLEQYLKEESERRLQVVQDLRTSLNTRRTAMGMAPLSNADPANPTGVIGAQSRASA